MNRAKNITKNRDENISPYENGDDFLHEISSDQFKCSDPECQAQLRLCSYRVDNIPAPYFKTLQSSQHRTLCENQIETFSLSTLSSRSVGLSAFNRMEQYFSPDNPNVVFYNVQNGSATRTNAPRRNDNNNRVRSATTTGPIICDEKTHIAEKATYMLDTADINIRKSETGNWLNIDIPTRSEGLGINISERGMEILNDNPTASIVIYCKNIYRGNAGRRYCNSPKVLYIVDKNLEHKD